MVDADIIKIVDYQGQFIMVFCPSEIKPFLKNYFKKSKTPLLTLKKMV